jgi:GNAT superfamily N-acetyltransferase
MANPFDQFDVATKAGNPFDQFDAPVKRERTLGEAATDIYAGLKGGVGSLLQLPSQVAGVVTGEFEKPGEETGLAAAGKGLQAEAQAMKSPGLKAREAARAEKVAAAEKRGQLDAFMTAFSETLRDPGLLTNFLAEQAPQLIPSLGVARLIKPFAGTAAAVRGAVGTGAVQQGADIAAGTYEQVYNELIKQGATEEEAAGRAIGLARTAGAGALTISLLAQRLPGAKAIEEAFAGQEGRLGRVFGAGRAGLGEAIGEVAEETPAKALQNYLMAYGVEPLGMEAVTPGSSLTAGLGETAAMAALGGAGMGAGVGLAQRQVGAEQVPPKRQPPSQFAPEPEAPIEPMPPVEPRAPAGAAAVPPTPPAPIEAAAPPVEPGVPPVEPPAPPAPPMPEPPRDAVDAMRNYWVGSPADFGMSFADIQNRDRTKPASIQQMTSIARRPDYNRLSVSRDFGAGAPVVISDIEIDPSRLGRIDTVSASDGTKIPVQYAVMDAREITPSNRADGTTIEQYADPAFEGIRPVAGNGRIAGLQELYRSGPYGDYVQQMMGDAAHGINPEVISAIEQPVLVRIMPKSALTPDIADKSNVGGQLGMSPTEQAKIDMNRFDLQGIQFLANGSPSLNSLRQFVAAMPPEEQGNLLNAEGQPNPLAKIRLANALFARAYANDSLIDLYAEATDPEAQQILRGMAIAAPAMSNLSEAGDYDIRPYVTKAAELAVNARRQGIDLAAYIDQGDLELDLLTREVVSMFAANKNAPRRIGDSLVMLAAEANRAAEQASAPPDMFGEVAFKRPLEDVFAILRGEPTQVAPIVEEEEAPEKLTYQIGKSEEQIAQEIDGMNVVQVADWLVDNAPNNFSKIVSEAVRSRVKAMQARKIPMTFKLLRGAERKEKVYGAVDGRYKGNVRFDVTINAPTAPGEKAAVVGTEYRTLLHEMLHLATQGQIHIEIGKGRRPTSGPIYELENLRKFIMKKVREDRAAGRPVPRRLNREQALLDVHELISYGFTEVEVQQYLASITYKNKNGFTRFVDAIRKLMAINKKDQTAMERLVSLTDEILEVPVKDIAAKLKAAGVRFGVGAIGTPSMADTRTPEFRKWFGKSKVVDQNGEPRVMYHGTVSDFDTFIPDSHFGTARAANQRARSWSAQNGERPMQIMPVYLRIENPLRVMDNEASDEAALLNAIKRGKYPQLDLGIANREGAYAAAKAAGYDGLVYQNKVEDRNKLSYVAFDPNQIKSIFNLRPTESKVITEEREAPEERPSFYPGMSQLGYTRIDDRTSPRIYTDEGGQPYLTFEKNGVRVALSSNNILYEDERGRVNEGYGEPNESIIRALIVDPEVRGQGRAKAVLREITDLADQSGTVLYIQPAPIAGGKMSVQQLTALYKQFGFVPAKGKSQKVLVREPKAETVTTEEREPFADISEEKLETPSRIQDKLEEKWDRMRTGAPKAKPSSFSDVDEGLWKDISGVFFPQNKNIVQKVDGMRDRFWQRLAQGVADQYRTIKDYSPEAYMKARMSKTIDGALEGILFEGEVKLTDGALDIAKDTKGLLKVMEPVGNEVDRYQIWVALQRDAQLVAQGKVPSVSKDIVARRDELSAGKIGDKSRLEVYQQVQKDMNKLNRSVLRIALKQGIIDKEAFKVFARDINYIPFYKVMDEGGSVQAAASKTGLVNQYFSKALQGGEKPFGDLMENTLRNWSHILSASMKNEAANATVKAAMDVGGAFPNLKVGLEWRLDDDGRNGKVYSAKTGEMIGDGSLKPQYTSSDGKGLVKTMIDGKPAYFEIVDPLLLESIMSIGYMGPKSKFLDVARDFKNILQFGVTVSPAFKVRNLIRDSVQSAAVSGIGLNIAKNVTDGIAASKKGNPDYISALAGGAIFNFGSYMEGDQAKMVKRLIEQGIKGENILDTDAKIKAGLKRMWDGYQDWGNRSEAANRMALYQQLRAKGFSHLEASFQARDLLDFSMQGAWPAVRMVTQVIPFLNARVQGLYKLGRDGITPTSRVIYNSITGKPIDLTDKQKAQQFSIVTGAVMLASLMLYMSFKDDDEWKKREQWDRDNFWWFKMPGMDTAIRIPKPFEIGAFGTFAERIAEQMFDQGAEGRVLEQSMKRMLTDTFAINPIPQVIKPLVDLYANKDSFTGAPIETAGMERLSKAERIAVGTSPLAKALSQVANVFLPESTELSPVQADYAIKAYLGWMGATISSTSHYAVMPFSKSAYPDHNWAETMSLGFVKTLPATQSGYVTSFYENSKIISQAYADMRHYAQIGESEKMRETFEEKGDKIMLAKLYDQTSKDMAKLRQVIQQIQIDERMSGAQKKEEIDRIKMLIGDLAKLAEETRVSVKKQYEAAR